MASEQSSPLKLGPSNSKKQKLSLNTSKCVICQTGNNEVVFPFTNNSKTRFFSSVNRRKDEIYEMFITEYGSFDNDIVKSLDIVYHKRCYKSYTSEHNIAVFTRNKVDELPTASTTETNEPPVLTRSKSSVTDWTVCVFCEKKSYKQNKKLCKLESDDRVMKIKVAANNYGDGSMLLKLSDERFKELAFYHNQCMTNYLVRVKSDTSDANERGSNYVDDNSPFDAAFSSFISDISDDLLKNKKAFLMTFLVEKFCSYLPNEIQCDITTRRLQRKLESYFGKSIVIQSQQGQGKANIVMSSSITLADAIKAASNLKADLSWSQTKYASCSKVEQTEDQLLHTVARILRNDISKMNFSDEYYPASSDVSFTHSLGSMPESLVKLLSWVMDGKAFNDCCMPSDVKLETMKRCLALAECIVANNRSAIVPFQLGLAIQVYHEFGSRRLVDILNTHGFCVTYTELRRCLTSVASHEIEHIDGDRYIPAGIKPVSEGGLLIQEGSDNIDLNTETIDGKNTFHSLARCVFQVQSDGESSDISHQIKRGTERSLPIDETTASLTEAIHFQKPQNRAEPPRRVDAFNKLKLYDHDTLTATDQIWTLCRLLSRDMVEFPFDPPNTAQTVPFWTGFNFTLSEKRSDFTVVAYPPIIDAKPSDMSTIYASMKKCLDMTNDAGQNHGIQTFDQQLYAVAQQVKWCRPDIFDNHIVRLGGFHSLACFLSSVGKLWADGGLRDLLVDSGVYAGNTAELMLAGKEFNRAVRGMTLVFEALQNLFFVAFWHWCRTVDKFDLIPVEFWDALVEFHSNVTDHNDSSSDNLTRLEELFQLHVLPLVVQFRKWGCDASPTFKYWDMFLVAIQIMLSNVRAERSGDWSAHLSSTSSMLPYFFITNRTNYSRWTPVYILDMLDLPEYVKAAFDQGQFSIRQSPGTFNGIWSDMGTEKTIIKDSKGSGGIVGITNQKSALVRWTLTRHFLASFSNAMNDRAGFSTSSNTTHDEMKPAGMLRDEEQVQAIIETVNNTMTDPFDVDAHPPCLINIATGMHATEDIQNSLLSAVTEGENMCKKFVTSALTVGQAGSFYSPITKSKLKTFEHMTAKTSMKCKTGEIVTGHINPEIVFRRALVLANSRNDVTIDSILSRPVGSVPISIFHEDGTMRKSCKSDLVKQMETETQSLSSLPDFDPSLTTLIRDGMALVQSIDARKYKTFEDLAIDFLKQLSKCYMKAHTVADVFDRYDLSNSIKSAERERRTKSSGPARVFQIINGRNIPDWKKFLSVKENKQALIKYFGRFFEECFQTETFLQEGHQYFMAGSFGNPELVKLFADQNVTNCPDLFSSHEEADTRMILHAIHADRRLAAIGKQGRIIIKSSDTDVVVLCVHFYPQMTNTEELWIQMGSIGNVKDGRRYLPIHQLCSSLSPTMCRILPAAHALSGCDTTSSFFGIGKKSVYKLLRDDSNSFHDLYKLGDMDTDEAITCSRRLVAKLYDQKKKFAASHHDLNKLRVKLATSKDASLVRLPPSEPAFTQHVLRASFQTQVWHASGLAKPPLPSPLDYGWRSVKESLHPIYFEGGISADFLQDLVCTCKGKTQCKKSCVCSDQNLACTELCSCQGSESCHNVQSQTLTDDSNSNS